MAEEDIRHRTETGLDRRQAVDESREADKGNHLGSSQGRRRPRPIVPYVEDPATGEIRIPPAIEDKLRRYTGGLPVRTKYRLAMALIAALEEGIREELIRIARGEQGE